MPVYSYTVLVGTLYSYSNDNNCYRTIIRLSTNASDVTSTRILETVSKRYSLLYLTRWRVLAFSFEGIWGRIVLRYVCFPNNRKRSKCNAVRGFEVILFIPDLLHVQNIQIT